VLCPLGTVAQHANKTHFMPLKCLFKVAWLAYSSCVGGLSLNFVDLIYYYTIPSDGKQL